MEVLCRQLSVTDTSNSINVDMTDLPMDKCFILSNLTVRVNPGALQEMSSLQIIGFTAAGFGFDIFREMGVGATATSAHNWQGQIFILGGKPGAVNLRCTAAFDLGVAGNEVRFAWHGVVIPRANVGPF